MHVAIFITIFIFSTSEILSFKLCGDYFVENEGYIPPTLMGDPISYVAGLTRSQYNKLITGTYYVSRKIGPVGMHAAFERASDGTNMGHVAIPNLCTSGYPIEPFRERFSGKILDDCTVEPGNYTLTNWSLEYHLRPKLKTMFYGRFIIHLKWMENNENCILEQSMGVIFKDRSNIRYIEENSDKVENTEENNARKRNRGNRNEKNRGKK